VTGAPPNWCWASALQGRHASVATINIAARAVPAGGILALKNL